jgi:regulator of sigma E protease
MYDINGAVIIDDIVEGSPADESGLENGDLIMAINNNFGAHIEAYKNLLQKTAEKIEILVMRDNRPIILYLKVGRIR